MTLIIFQQAVIMFFLLAVGFGCFRRGMLSNDTVSQLSKFVLQVVNPVVIFLAYQREFETELAVNLGVALLLSLIAFVIAMGIAYLVIRPHSARDVEIERFACIYSNCAFMGIPLVQALLGDEGVFYLTAFITFFNLIVWSHGVMMMSGQTSFISLLHVLISPSMIAIVLGMTCFFCQFFIPDLLAETCEIITGVNTPMAMIIAGATIAQTDLVAILKKKRLYLICSYRLLLIPLLTCVMLLVLPFSSTVEITILTATAAPTGAICIMQSIMYQRNATYASEIFGITTLFSMLTMPLIITIYAFLA